MGFGQSPHEAAIYVNDLVITGTKDAEVVTFKVNATF
jgi:hypothetical protein